VEGVRAVRCGVRRPSEHSRCQSRDIAVGRRGCHYEEGQGAEIRECNSGIGLNRPTFPICCPLPMISELSMETDWKSLG
jgi:hypothetical protein